MAIAWRVRADSSRNCAGMLPCGGGALVESRRRRSSLRRLDSVSVADAGKAVVVISSELPELLGITDRIYTIFEGEVTGQMRTADADQEMLMRLMTSSRNRARIA